MIDDKRVEQFFDLVNQHKAITLLTHINPDADTIGTALGLYSVMKTLNKSVEVVNFSKQLPNQLDFLPNFSKIKHKIDFKDSLIITCDCGSVDRLGESLEALHIDKRELINIDHHKSNTNFGTLNIVESSLASASQVACELLKNSDLITADVATCFYTALVSDTLFFTTASVNAETFTCANMLVQKGANVHEVNHNLTLRKSLGAYRILQFTLQSLTLYNEGTVGVIVSSKEDIEASGANMSDMDGIISHVRALATVQIAIHLMHDGNMWRVSLRSKSADVAKLAKAFGGGGHKLAAGFSLEVSSQIEDSVGTILQTIETLGILREEKEQQHH